ncbi:SDR family NAD(P)-dependent oxidoreductase [Akkermansiaceae bacterium]|nr:SDR family NAD(P)-dependent oxidoreductase [Akkermansiaceae bacterium]
MKPTASMEKAFGGATVVLTGAASGIGRGLAKLLCRSGAVIHALDVDGKGLESLVAEAEGSGEIHVRRLDVTDYVSYSKAVEGIIAQSGAIDFLFNNAGVTLLGEAQNIPFERWKWLLDINLMGAVHGTQLVYPAMLERGSGCIVNTASIAGSTGYATAAAYTASKAAILEFSRSLRAEVGANGVKVCVVCPGYVNSGIFAEDRIVGVSRDAMIKDLPVAMMSPERAAWHYLKGVSLRKETIIFPFSARFLWFLSCWFPGMLLPFQRRFMRVFQGGGGKGVS